MFKFLDEICDEVTERIQTLEPDPLFEMQALLLAMRDVDRLRDTLKDRDGRRKQVNAIWKDLAVNALLVLLLEEDEVHE